MAYRNIPVQSPIQGRSQGPDFTMLPGQAKDILNIVPRLPYGAQRRNPLVLRKDVEETYVEASEEILYGKTQDGTDWAFLLKADGSMVAHQCEAPYTTADAVTISTAAAAYIAENRTKGRFVMKSIAGNTFLVNQNMVVANDASAFAPTRPYEGIIWCAEGVFSSIYKVTISLKDASSGPWFASWTTDVGTEIFQAERATPEYIIGALLDSSPSTGGTYAGETLGLRPALVGAGFTVIEDGSIIYLSHPTKDFTIEIEDSARGQRLSGIKDEILTFAKLPPRAYDGFTIKVIQDAASDRDDFWVKFEGAASDTEGTWKETIAPGAPLGLDPETMPIAGTYNAGTNTWAFDTFAWGQRTIGDLELVPDPDFIGQTINDLSFAFGRLVLVYGESAALSSAQGAGVFYPTTLAALNPADPIFLTSTLETTVTCLFAIPFPRRLLIASTGGLFEVGSSEGNLTIDTAYMAPISGLATSPDARPFVVNNKLYNLSLDEESGQRTLHELRTSELTGTDAADPLTTHDPDLIPPGRLFVATNADEYTTLYVEQDGQRIGLHCYRYAENGQRIQNALVPWTLPSSFTIRGALAFDGVFGFHFTDPTGALLYGTLSFAREDKGFGAFHQIHLDASFLPDPILEMTYSEPLRQTVISLPYVVTEAEASRLEAVMIGGFDEASGQFAEGTALKILAADTTTLTVEGDATGIDFVVGLRWPCYWVPARPYPRSSGGDYDISSQFHVTGATLSVRRSGHIKFEQLDRTAQDVVDVLGEFSGLMLNDFQSKFDTPVIYDGEIPHVGIYQDASEFYLRAGTEEFYPLTITQLTWFGQYNPQAMQG